MVSETISTVAELSALGSKYLATLNLEVGATVLALHGDLGAGKTTFVQTLARSLGVTETVTSPTFVIMKQYGTNSAQFTTLIHIDAYRIETDDEMRPLRFAELLAQPQTLICVEWAERIQTLLPKGTVHISLVLNQDESRTITYGN